MTCTKFHQRGPGRVSGSERRQTHLGRHDVSAILGRCGIEDGEGRRLHEHIIGRLATAEHRHGCVYGLVNVSVCWSEPRFTQSSAGRCDIRDEKIPREFTRPLARGSRISTR